MKSRTPSNMPNWKKVSNHGLGRGVYLQDGFDVSKPLYRYMSAANFENTLRSSQLYMSNVRRWADPYERWWCDQLFRVGSKLDGVHAYGLCWTRKTRDEPFWRLYQDRCSHLDDHGIPLVASPPPVRIRSTVSSLVALLSAKIDQIEAKVFIGDVFYSPEAVIKSKAESLRIASNDVARDAATALNLKRLAFKFEQEVRVLWIDRLGKRPAQIIDFNPLSLIDAVMIGPSLDVDSGKRLKTVLVPLGMPAEKIKRSMIYCGPSLQTP